MPSPHPPWKRTGTHFLRHGSRPHVGHREIAGGNPCYCGDIQGELCTPTGAALLERFGKEFCAMLPMAPFSTGCGMGTREYPTANCVRAFWGERSNLGKPSIVELCCHIDDMTAEARAYAGERLLALGALDVTSAPLVMKKVPAGILFTVLCKPADEKRIARAVLRETSTSGIRPLSAGMGRCPIRCTEHTSASCLSHGIELITHRF